MNIKEIFKTIVKRNLLEKTIIKEMKYLTDTELEDIINIIKTKNENNSNL